MNGNHLYVYYDHALFIYTLRFRKDNFKSYISVSQANYLEKSVANAVYENLDGIKINCEDTSKMSKSTPISIKHLRSQKNNGDNSPPQISCVEAICDIVVEQLPDLWRLGQSYFTGQLHVAVDVEKQSHFKVCTLRVLHLFFFFYYNRINRKKE